MLTIREYLEITQPEVAGKLWAAVIVIFQEEELTPHQQYLERLMRQTPRPGG